MSDSPPAVPRPTSGGAADSDCMPSASDLPHVSRELPRHLTTTARSSDRVTKTAGSRNSQLRDVGPGDAACPNSELSRFIRPRDQSSEPPAGQRSELRDISRPEIRAPRHQPARDQSSETRQPARDQSSETSAGQRSELRDTSRPEIRTPSYQPARYQISKTPAGQRSELGDISRPEIRAPTH